MNLEIKKYQPDFFCIWNEFISKSKNGTFLFHRNFMEYHQDRFLDYSLLFFNEGILVAVLPANVIGNRIYSHQGLTYGGLVVSDNIRSIDFFQIFQILLKYLNNQGFTYLHIKDIPHFYVNQFSDEIKYLQFFLGAEIYRKDICSVINLSENFYVSKSVKRDFNLSVNRKYRIVFNDDIKLFWNDILEPNLWQTYRAKPVHELSEMLLLKKLFPQNIIQANVYSATNKIVAGTTLFVTDKVVHSQYISLNKEFSKDGILDFLYFSLIEKFKSEKKYFDFGVSNENQGKNINKGLLFWKEKFGARSAIQEFYKFETNSFSKLDHLYL